ncbi:hypothetical protein Tco_0808683 [Tanacetum coccineum]
MLPDTHILLRPNLGVLQIGTEPSVTNTVISSDLASSEEPDSPEAVLASPNYVPGPEEPEQAPLSPYYVSGPEYPKYLALFNEEVPMEDQPYAVADSPIALSLGYVTDLDLEEDPKEDSEDGPVDYPANGGDGNDDDSFDDDEEEEALEEQEDEHLAPVDSVVAPVVDHVPSSKETKPFETDESAATPPSPPACHTTTRISIRPEASMPFPSEEEIKRLLALPSPPPSPLSPWSSPLPQIPSPPLPPLPSSLHLPPHVPTSLPLPSSPLPPLPASLFIPPLVDRKEDTPEAELPPSKRLCLTALTLRIRDTWVDPREAAKEIALVTLEGDRQTQIFQSVETLIDDRQYNYKTARLLDQEALVSREARAHSMGFSLAVHYELQGYRTHAWMQDHREIRALQARDQAPVDSPKDTASTVVGLVFSFLVSDNHKNMPPRRSSATARAAAAAARAAAPMTAAAVEQLIEARVSAALANHETL